MAGRVHSDAQTERQMNHEPVNYGSLAELGWSG